MLLRIYQHGEINLRTNINIMTLLNKIKGYKTLAVALCGFIYGVSVGSVEIILASLALAGMRDAIK